VDTIESPGHSPLLGVHLKIIVKGQEIDTYLGPTDFIKDMEITFSKGDVLRISGMKVMIGGKRIILAREISRGGTVLYLRDQTGQPNWRKNGP
jgi:hypothetical protein